ncbi:hypothetical protein AURDEDRAFT_171511 [Auricularia subglabra TFB-10046 SS5]|nr:hypothetical protein AURDEDRAFT_171511 [Auricularia subglabra TFB-10046 SS5]
MSFAGLNQGTAIKGSTSVWSYIVFFVLVWTMWAQQTIYHTRYYSDDAWNRIVLVCQFLMLGFIAAFTNDFNVSLGISHGLIIGNVGPDTLPRDPDDRYGYRGFQALAVIFFVSRLLLIIEYADVYRIATRQHIHARALCRMISSLSISAILFLASFILAMAKARDPTANIIKFVLWGLAVVLELVAYLWTEFPESMGTRISVSPIEERLCALTIIIIGEGLNSSIEPIVGTTRSIGFNFASGAEILAWGFTIFLIYVLYVSSFTTSRHAPSPLRQRLVTVCHLPLQLFIILFAEGAKAVLSVVTLNNSLLAVAPLLQQCRLKPISDQISILRPSFLRIGINIESLADRFSKLTVAKVQQENYTEVNLRLTAAAFQRILNDYYVTSDQTNTDLTNYAYSSLYPRSPLNDTYYVLYRNSQGPNRPHNLTSARDPADFLPDVHLPPFLDNMIKHQAYNDELNPSRWVVGVAGGFLVFLAVLMLVKGHPRVAWLRGQVWARLGFGVALVLSTFVTMDHNALYRWLNSGWYLPTILLAYAVVYLLDYDFAYMLRRRQRAQTSLNLSQDSEGGRQFSPDLPSSDAGGEKPRDQRRATVA